LGRLVLNQEAPDSVATLCGAAIYIFLMYCSARLPIHYAALWAVVLAIPIVLDWRGTRDLVFSVPARLRSAGLGTWGGRLAFALLMQWLVVLKPEQSADGLAMHLAIPANIAVNHAFTLQPSQVVWSVMPMGADFLYSIAYLLGGEFAARLLNFWMLMMVAA